MPDVKVDGNVALRGSQESAMGLIQTGRHEKDGATVLITTTIGMAVNWARKEFPLANANLRVGLLRD
jgi:hypothetical protein